MRQLSTLLLSLLLCATCLAQPDSRPGPYQATLAKINALLVGGAATVKEIEFTVDGSALASSSKTQVYSDGNAGSLFVRVPTAKMVQGLVNSNILLNLGRAGNALSDTNWSIGKYGSGPTYDGTAPGIVGVGSNIYANAPTGGSLQFSLNNGTPVVNFSLANQIFAPATIEVARFDSDGLTLVKNLYYNGAGTASSTLTTEWADAANGNKFSNVPTGKYYAFDFAAVEKYRFAAALAEFNRLSLGGTIGSSTDPGAGGLALNGKFYISTTQTPASAGATGTVGQVCWDSSYIYICTAANTWKRAAIATW